MTASKLRATVLAAIVASALILAAGCTKEFPMDTLRAGPIQMKFQDGELRYLYVGNKEIVRRMYFAVRDGRWQTPMPVFSKCQVEQKADSFKISLAATCKSETVDYAWTGEIIGSADGQITFSVTGVPQKDFRANRIGICVLYGADSLVGQEFYTTSADGQSTPGKFPDIVKMELVAKDYRSLKYTTAGGLSVDCGLTPVLFTMEDQRNYGDSSFKAYNSVLTGPDAIKDQQATVTATLKVTGAKPAAPAAGPVRIVIGKPIEGIKLPKLLVAKNDAARTADFLSLDKKRDQLADQPEIVFGFKPSTHLPDDDTLMENRTGIYWQLKTLHALAPKSRIRVAPIRLTDPADARGSGLFAASWAVGALRQLALGNADEAVFAIDTGLIDSLLGKFATAQFLNVGVIASGPSPVEVLALYNGPQTLILIANSTTSAQKVVLEGLRSAAVRISHGLLPTKAGQQTRSLPAEIEVAPYGVYSVTITADEP